jgi:glutamate formiminotransferase
VELASDDGALAEEIARRVAQLPGVEAQAGRREGAGLVQVRVRLADHSQVGLVRVYEEIERAARERGVEAGASELTGLVPRAALPPGTLARTRLRGFDARRQLVEEILGR